MGVATGIKIFSCGRSKHGNIVLASRESQQTRQVNVERKESIATGGGRGHDDLISANEDDWKGFQTPQSEKIKWKVLMHLKYILVALKKQKDPYISYIPLNHHTEKG